MKAAAADEDGEKDNRQTDSDCVVTGEPRQRQQLQPQLIATQIIRIGLGKEEEEENRSKGEGSQ